MGGTQRHGAAGKARHYRFLLGRAYYLALCGAQPRDQGRVAWYGRLEGNRNGLQPTYPIDIAGDLKVPVLGLYGGADSGIPQESVERMRQALEGKNSGSEIVVYPDTPHAFFADYRPSYRKEAAEDGWQRLQAWFAAHGLPPA